MNPPGVHEFNRTQLWGAANPTNAPGVPFIFDASARVGMCGDWLLGSSVESACLSGLAMAGGCMPVPHIPTRKADGTQWVVLQGNGTLGGEGVNRRGRGRFVGLQSTSTIKRNSPGREGRWIPPSA